MRLYRGKPSSFTSEIPWILYQVPCSNQNKYRYIHINIKSLQYNLHVILTADLTYLVIDFTGRITIGPATVPMFIRYFSSVFTVNKQDLAISELMGAQLQEIKISK